MSVTSTTQLQCSTIINTLRTGGRIAYDTQTEKFLPSSEIKTQMPARQKTRFISDLPQLQQKIDVFIKEKKLTEFQINSLKTAFEQRAFSLEKRLILFGYEKRKQAVTQLKNMVRFTPEPYFQLKTDEANNSRAILQGSMSDKNASQVKEHKFEISGQQATLYGIYPHETNCSSAEKTIAEKLKSVNEANIIFSLKQELGQLAKEHNCDLILKIGKIVIICARHYRQLSQGKQTALILGSAETFAHLPKEDATQILSTMSNMHYSSTQLLSLAREKGAQSVSFVLLKLDSEARVFVSLARILK